MALAKIAALYARMGDFQRADSAYTSWKAVQYEGNHTRDYFIVDYMKKRGLYQEAVIIYNDLIERVRQQGDTLGEMMNTAKWALAEVYQKMGRHQQAATLYEQVLEIQDTLKSRKAKNTAQELAAIYHDKEQEQKILEQETENTRQNAIIIVLVILLVVATIAVIVVRKNKAINRKNHRLAQQIAETMNYKKMYWEDRQAPEPTLAPNLNIASEEDTFKYINEIIIFEKLYLDPTFGRQAIMDRFQLSKERVGAVFSKGSEYSRLNSYIQQLRLDYAAKLLVEQPNKSVVNIAEECGFSSHTYFSGCFHQHFDMSPSDFRREALMQEENNIVT